ncbi:MAG: DNA repair protein RecO [Nitrospirae bacterium]|nr:DNA repair protein RecO [Nitrospirota bacterium]
MLLRTEGIVLKTHKYGEADLIVTYFTLQKGIIKAFAKSPRKTKSRFGSSMEPLTYSMISLWGKEQSMPKITQSDIISSFHNIRENLHDFINSSKLIEILLSLTPEGIPNKRLFSFLLNTLNLIASLEQKQKETFYLILQVHLLTLLGYAPRLKGCGKCGAKTLDFYPSLGTPLCGKCAVRPLVGKEPPVRITEGLINFYSHCLAWPVYILRRLKPRQDTIAELSFIIDKHLNHLLQKRLLTSEFLVRKGANHV